MMIMIPRRRIFKTRRTWALMLLVAVFAVCTVMPRFISRVQLSVLQAQSEQIYRHNLNLRKQLCLNTHLPGLNNNNGVDNTTTTTTTTNNSNNININNKNDNSRASSYPQSSSFTFPSQRHLFFKSCHVDLDLNHPPSKTQAPFPLHTRRASLPRAIKTYRLGLPIDFACLEKDKSATAVVRHQSHASNIKTTITNSTLSADRTKNTSTSKKILFRNGRESSRKSNGPGFYSLSTVDITIESERFNSGDTYDGDDDDDDDDDDNSSEEKYRTCQGHTVVPGRTPVPSVPFQDPCLKRFVERHCFDAGLPVPRLVHYVWFGKHSMDVVTFLSVLAAYRYLRPCLIMFHADSEPEGSLWRALPSLVPVLLLVRREAPAEVWGRPLGAVQHKSDIARMEAIKEYGGIYLDGDQVVLRNLDQYRHKDFVMGHESQRNLANSLLVSAPSARFLEIWYRNYRSYNPRQWGIHSTFLPLTLAKVYPNMIHKAGYAFVNPDLPRILEVWEGHYNWTDNHAIHLYYRSMVQWKVRTDYTLQQLLALKSSLGEIARHVVFGSKDACWGNG